MNRKSNNQTQPKTSFSFRSTGRVSSLNSPHRKKSTGSSLEDKGLLGVQPLLDIIKLTLQTGYIKNTETPTNLLLIAKPEHAKTKAMESFKIKGTYTTNNITQWIIAHKILPMIENQALKHLLIPDLLNAIEKDYTTRKGFLNLIKTLIEEGVTSLDTFNIRTEKVYNPPVKCGLITGITQESFIGHYDNIKEKWVGGVKYEWKAIGLLSRFIPFSYDYDALHLSRIFRYIEREEHLEKVPKQTITRKLTEVKGNPELFSRLEQISLTTGQELGGYGLRLQRNLQTLTKANALLNGRNYVTEEDIDKVLFLGKWMNFRFVPL